MNDRMPFLDFHTHILPCIDDGSSSVEMSTEMLSRSADQGVGCIVLTPHFYANTDSLSRFLEKRTCALQMLRQRWQGASPILLPGAEVYYFRDMADIEELSLLRIHNTELLLLEMPFRKWTDAMMADILRLNERKGIRVVLAHIDRYMSDQPKGTFETLSGHGVLMQVNADAFLEKNTRQRAFQLFEAGLIHFLGSDCHDLTNRPPVLVDGLAALREQFGDEMTDSFVKCGLRRLLAARRSSAARRNSDNEETPI